MKKVSRESFWQTVGDHPFGVLLLSLFLMMAAAPAVSQAESAELFRGMSSIAPLTLIVVAASMLALWQRARHHALNMLAGGFIIVTLAIGSFISHRAWIPVQLGAQIVFLSYVLWIVMRSVFRARTVTGDILCGAVCIYLLTAVLAGLVFIQIELAHPGSFRISNWSSNPLSQEDSLISDPGWLIYFSFITFTTVGYGDVLPDSAFARSAAVIVAVIGQMLLMVIIGRLVGINVAQASGTDRTPDPPR